MKTKDIKKGISLIVLIITIIVVIILAAVVILTLSKNNPIESAKEARFKEDVRTFQDELALYISKQYTNAGGHWDGNISAKTCDEIKNYIPSFTKKYEGKFIINNNNLEYTNELDEKEKEYAQNLNVKEKPKQKLLPNEYQQVEYIESTGTQYIKTDFVSSSDLKIVAVVEPKQLHNLPYSMFLFCARVDSTNNNFSYSSGNTAFYGVGDNYKPNNNIPLNERVNLEYTTNYINITSSNYNYFDDNYSFSITNPQKLYIFTCIQNDVIDLERNGAWRVFSFKILKKDNLVGNLIPCYLKKNNIKGLYDTVEGKFYTNQGTGEDFIAGPEVDE